LSAGEGGVVALVGARGLGKSFLLRALEGSEAGAIFLDAASLTEPLHALSARLGLPRDPRGRALVDVPRLVLIDDAQQLVRPVIGGLRRFDELIALARASSSGTLWVFAIDAVLWPLLARGREVRPLFDQIHMLEPWTDRQIGALLAERSAHAGIAPTFEDLLEQPPASEDELDREDALSATRESYVLMLWDYVAGNPGLALEAWRSSLVEDEHGVVRARPLHVAPANELDVLPDSTLFVLRAILQLAPASPRDVAEATRLSQEQVLNVFRFGQMQGYLADRAGRVEVSWRWLRSVTRLLERRHLLVNH
ncbi:MAG TPA: ATP-binding protein, partial [Polyangiaceae bacterium]|nr:ATP-binding protein [Polyangiaceae bacterium]